MYLKDSPTFDGNVTVTGTTLLTGVATLTAAPVFSSATASQAVFTNGSKALVSNAITGTGNVVMSASPTLTGTIAGAAMTLSSTLGVTGATTLSSTVATGALTVTGAATVSTTLGVTGAITSATSVALTGTTNNLGTITTGVWNAGAVTSSGGISGTTGTFSGILKIAADTWHTSSDNNLRLYYATNGINYFRSGAGSGQMFSWMNASSVEIASMSAGGSTTLGGVLTVSGLGQSTFSAGGNSSNSIRVENTSAGTGAIAAVNLRNDGTWNGGIRVLSSTFTTSGPDLSDGMNVHWNGPSGMSIAATHASGAIRFYTGGSTERLKIAADGSLTSGTVAVNNNFVGIYGASGQAELGSSSKGSSARITFYNSAAVGTITTSGSATAYNTSSDARLKRSLGIASHTDVLSKTVIRDFEWLADGVKSRGVFAQEAYLVFPSAITVGDDSLTSTDKLAMPWMADYSKFVPDLIVGWQQHDATISQLAARIAALETKDH